MGLAFLNHFAILLLEVVLLLKFELGCFGVLGFRGTHCVVCSTFFQLPAVSSFLIFNFVFIFNNVSYLIIADNVPMFISLHFISLFVQPNLIALFIVLLVITVFHFDNATASFIAKVSAALAIINYFKAFLVEFTMFLGYRVNYDHVVLFIVKGDLSVEVSFDSVTIFVIEGLVASLRVLFNFIPVIIVPMDFSSKRISFYLISFLIKSSDLSIEANDDTIFIGIVPINIAELVLLNSETMFIILFVLSGLWISLEKEAIGRVVFLPDFRYRIVTDELAFLVFIFVLFALLAVNYLIALFIVRLVFFCHGINNDPISMLV